MINDCLYSEFIRLNLERLGIYQGKRLRNKRGDQKIKSHNKEPKTDPQANEK